MLILLYFLVFLFASRLLSSSRCLFFILQSRIHSTYEIYFCRDGISFYWIFVVVCIHNRSKTWHKWLQFSLFFSFPSSICFNDFFPLIFIPSTRYFRVQMFSIFHMMMYVIFVSLVIFLLCSPIYIPCSITETHNICIWLHNFVFRNHFFYVLPLLLRLCRGMFLCVLFSIRTNVIDGGAVFYSKLFAFVPFKV